jgi:hypothetical protein
MSVRDTWLPNAGTMAPTKDRNATTLPTGLATADSIIIRYYGLFSLRCAQWPVLGTMPPPNKGRRKSEPNECVLIRFSKSQRRFIDKPSAIRMVAACSSRPGLAWAARLAPH